MLSLDLDERGVAVDGGICPPSPPQWQPDGSVLFAVRGPAEGHFLRLDPVSGEEAVIGRSVSGFLFSEASSRDGAWALSTGDGADTFCGGSQRPWPGDPIGPVGNTVQLLRPDDDLAWTLEAPPLASGFGRSVSLAAGGWCAAIPDSEEWNAPMVSFDLASGEQAAFPEGFTFLGWLGG